MGEHPLVCRLLRGIRLSFPPLPRYSSLWDVNTVQRLLQYWQENQYLYRKELTGKLAMLLCLISCKRVSDVRALEVTAQVFTPEGVSFTVAQRTKSNTSVVHYPAFPGHPKLSVVRCLRTSEMMTEEYRPPGVSELFLSLKKLFKAVTAAMISRWVRWVLQEAGIDTTAFGAHSARGAMASKAFTLAGAVEDILRAAD